MSYLVHRWAEQFDSPELTVEGLTAEASEVYGGCTFIDILLGKRYHGSMGITMLEITLQNPAAPKRSITKKFLVDSGAAYSVVPASVLKTLKIKPTTKRRFVLANGETVEWPVGNALFRFQQEEGASPVIFGDKDDIYLLGVVTLESLGLILDPIRRELKPLPMLLMGLV